MTQAVSSPHGDETVLAVEDDPMVRGLVTKQLRALGYSVWEAGNPAEALEQLERHPDVRLLFTDVIMPGGVSGPQLASKAIESRPGLKVLFTSGYGEQAMLEQAGWSPSTPVLKKPYTRSTLAEAVRRAIDGRTLPQRG